MALLIDFARERAVNILFWLRSTGGEGRNRARLVIYNIDVNAKKNRRRWGEGSKIEIIMTISEYLVITTQFPYGNNREFEYVVECSLL